MKSTRICNTLDAIYFLVGTLAFSLSAYVEMRVLCALMGGWLFPLLLTTALELSKVLCIVAYRSSATTEASFSTAPRAWLPRLFAWGLVSLSLSCSLMLFSNALHAPNLETVMAEDRQKIEREYEERIALAQQQLAEDKRQISKYYEARRTEARQFYAPRIGELEKELRAEMDNVVNGVFKGQRYQEFERLLRENQQALADRLAALNRKAQAEYAAKASQVQRLQQLRQEQADTLQALHPDQYLNDSRVQNQMVVATLGLLQGVFGLDLNQQHVSVWLSLLLSLLLEASILLLFQHLAQQYAPLLAAYREVQVALERSMGKAKVDLGEDLAQSQVDQERLRTERARVNESIDDLIQRYSQKNDGQS